MHHPHAYNNGKKTYPVIATIKSQAPETWEKAGWKGESIFSSPYIQQVYDYYATHKLSDDNDKYNILNYVQAVVDSISKHIVDCFNQANCNPQATLQTELKRLRDIKLFLHKQRIGNYREWDLALRNATDTINRKSTNLYLNLQEKINSGLFSNFSQEELRTLYQANGFLAAKVLPTKALDAFDIRILQNHHIWTQLPDDIKIKTLNDLFAAFPTLDLKSNHIEQAIKFIDYCYKFIPKEKMSPLSDMLSQKFDFILNKFLDVPTVEINKQVIENFSYFMKLFGKGTENTLQIRKAADILQKLVTENNTIELNNKLISSFSNIINKKLHQTPTINASMVESALLDTLELCRQRKLCTKSSLMSLFDSAGLWESINRDNGKGLQIKIFDLLKNPDFAANAKDLFASYITPGISKHGENYLYKIMNACLDAGVDPLICKSPLQTDDVPIINATEASHTDPTQIIDTTPTYRNTSLALPPTSSSATLPTINSSSSFFPIENTTAIIHGDGLNNTLSSPTIRPVVPSTFPYLELGGSFLLGGMTPIMIRGYELLLAPCEKYCRPFVFNTLKILIPAILISGAASLPLLVSLMKNLEGETDSITIEWKIFTFFSMIAFSLISEKLGQYYNGKIVSRVITPFFIAANCFLASDTTTAIGCYLANTFANAASNLLLECYDRRKKTNNSETSIELTEITTTSYDTLRNSSSSDGTNSTTLSSDQFIPGSDNDFYYASQQLAPKLKSLYETNIQVLKELLKENNQLHADTKEKKALLSKRFSDLQISEANNVTVKDALDDVSTLFKILANLTQSFSNIAIYHANLATSTLALADLEQCRKTLNAINTLAQERIESLNKNPPFKNSTKAHKLANKELENLQIIQTKIKDMLKISDVSLLE
ncbi:MAG: hypothetical protein REH83_03625, partial [Rickettsiella sp.]|nr:hypothetical protein [Rickettsiella sp.]